MYWVKDPSPGEIATSFFPWRLRRSTLDLILRITFRRGCFCTQWITGDEKEWTATGRAVRSQCFSPLLPKSQLPDPSRARKAYIKINENIWAADNSQYDFNYCRRCLRKSIARR